MQFEYDMNNYCTRLLEMLPNKFLMVCLGVLFVLLFFSLNNVQAPSSYGGGANSIFCEIQSSNMINSNDARQSNSTVSILQTLNFNRLFQLDLLFKFQLAGRFLMAFFAFYLVFCISRKIQIFKFFYQIYIKSSIPCRAGPHRKSKKLFSELAQIMVI